MRVGKETQNAALEAYWAALQQDPDAVPSAALDPGLARTARRLTALIPPMPEGPFVEQLGLRLQAQAATVRGDSVPRPMEAARPGSLDRHTLRGRTLRLAAAALVAVGLVALLVLAARPPAVSAQAILRQAQAAASSPAAGGVQTFVLRESWHAWRRAPEGTQQIVSEYQIWYEGPKRWRSEWQQRVLQPDGTELSRSDTLVVSDGQDLWHYDRQRNLVTINGLSGQDARVGISPFGQGVEDLSALLDQASTCYDAQVRRSATVAGREAYVIDLGPSLCPSTSAPEMNGRRVIWVDKETYFVLRQEQYSVEGDTLLKLGEVIEVQYNVPVDPSLLEWAPPDGARVLDGRPRAVPTVPPTTPAPNASPVGAGAIDPRQEALVAALEPLARAADFPLFVPDHIPEGLAPRLPRLQPVGEAAGSQLWLEYALVGEVELDTAPALRIVELPAIYESARSWTLGGIPIRVPEGKAWVRLGTQDLIKGNIETVVIALRDGTLVALTSSAVPPEELWALAARLQPVPGSHAPLQEPVAPAGEAWPTEPPPVDAIPTLTPMPTPSFAVLQPTWLPEPMEVRMQVEGEIVLLGFVPEGHDGTTGILTLREVPLRLIGEGGASDPQASQQVIGGQAVTVIRRGDGCVTYTWDMDGLRLTLSNFYLAAGELAYSCEEMERIVASVR